jgi:hypothetical protein
VKRLQIIALSVSILAIAGFGANQWYTFQKKWNIDHYDWKKNYFIGSDGFLHRTAIQPSGQKHTDASLQDMYDAEEDSPSREPGGYP